MEREGASRATVWPLERLVPDGHAPERARAAAEFARLLAQSRLHEALALLNARTRFRFTGIYRVEPPVLRNVHLYDRENPGLNVSGSVCPLSDSYCSIACAADRPFATGDALRDPRLASHPARGSVLSYSGVPVRSPGGQLLGTLCHFDVRPRIVPAAELPLLEAVATLVARWLESASDDGRSSSGARRGASGARGESPPGEQRSPGGLRCARRRAPDARL